MAKRKRLSVTFFFLILNRTIVVYSIFTRDLIAPSAIHRHGKYHCLVSLSVHIDINPSFSVIKSYRTRIAKVSQAIHVTIFA